jgi:hypothetical protein
MRLRTVIVVDTILLLGAIAGYLFLPGATGKNTRFQLAANAAPVSFNYEIQPLLNQAGCAAADCHGATRGKNGFKLSLFGADPAADYEAIVKTAGGRYLDRLEPKQSLLLLKAAQTLPHEGGAKLPAAAPEYQRLLLWLAQGAPERSAPEPALSRVAFSSPALVLGKGSNLALSVTGVFTPGERREVTPLTLFQSSDPDVASVDRDGRLQARNFGQTTILALYARQSATLSVTVPQPLATPFPEITTTNRLDELVLANLKKLGLPPSPPCGDEEFLRRVYLDVTGLLPTADQARSFLSHTNLNQRTQLIDRLLRSEEFADFCALKWGDLLRIKSEYPVRVWPKGVAAYYRWVRESIAANKPYQQFARELLTATGSDFRDGPANFFRAMPNKDPQTIAETASLVFLGARLGCARCHAHPTENWTLRDDLGMAAFFAPISYKSTLEWKEEIVYLNPKNVLRHPRTKDVVAPKFLAGPACQTKPGADPRTPFADWLTSPDNPWFARNIANRVWYWLLGRGIVHEPDDLRPTNPPENPELLDYLAGELTSHGYNLKHLYRLILNSDVYQAASTPLPQNAWDKTHFSHYLLKRLGAEQLSDAICQVTEAPEKFSSIIPEPFTYLPPGHRATQLADGNIGTAFLELFGRPSRDTPYESERNAEPSLWQELYLVNSDQLESKITASPRLKRLIKSGKSDAEIIDEIYLAALARHPREDESQTLLAYFQRQPQARAQAASDVLWAVLNTKEFIFIR